MKKPSKVEVEIKLYTGTKIGIVQVTTDLFLRMTAEEEKMLYERIVEKCINRCIDRIFLEGSKAIAIKD